MKMNDYTSTFKLFKLALKRDRITIPIWIFSTSIFVFLVTLANGSLSSEEMIQMVKSSVNNPGMRLMVSPISGHVIDHLGAFIFFRMSFLLAILVAAMNNQLIIRHTRQNEETGRSELIASTATGKRAPLSAAFLLAFVTNTLLSAGLAIALLANSLEFVDSITTSISYGLLGLFFAGIAAIASELSMSSKGAGGLASMALALTYLLNAAGNAMGVVAPNGMGYESHKLVWASPLGWVQQVRPYDFNNAFPLILLLLGAALMSCIAYMIVKHRDIGTGIIPAKMGRTDAKKWMLSPLGFAIKLQRPLLIGWMIPVVIFSLVFGAAAQEFGNVLQDTELLRNALKSAHNSFIYMMLGVMSCIISFYTLQSFMRVHHEEVKGLAEGILSTPLRRTTYILSHIACSFCGTIILLSTFVGILLTSLGSKGSISTFLLYALQNSCVVLLLLSIAILLYGFVPKWSSFLSWAVLSISMLTGPFLGAILQLPDEIKQLSPFTQFGFVYNGDQWPFALILVGLSIVLSVLGIKGFSSRSLHV